MLKGGTVIPPERDAFIVTRSLPHGQVAAALGTARKIGLDHILGPDSNRCRDLILALLVGRILDPISKLAAARTLSPATASPSLGEALGLGEVDDDELYAALDWLHERQPAIESALAKRHLRNGTLVLYDVSSSYMEERCCPLAKRGYSRDGKKGTLQIGYVRVPTDASRAFHAKQPVIPGSSVLLVQLVDRRYPDAILSGAPSSCRR